LGEREGGGRVGVGGAVGGQHDRPSGRTLGRARGDDDDRARGVLHDAGGGRAQGEVRAGGQPPASDAEGRRAPAGLEAGPRGDGRAAAVARLAVDDETRHLLPHRADDVGPGGLVERPHAPPRAIGRDDLERRAVVTGPDGGPGHGTACVVGAVVPAHDRSGGGGGHGILLRSATYLGCGIQPRRDGRREVRTLWSSSQESVASPNFSELLCFWNYSEKRATV